MDEPSSFADAVASPVPAVAAARNLFPRRDFFAKYDILKRIGLGGQGDVWEVWDFEFRRRVAMKRLDEKAVRSEAAVYRFLAEAQIASQLDHPGILPIFDVGLDTDGRPFYTTQLLPGTTLADVWKAIHSGGGPGWSLNRALELLLRVCDVMAHAHSRGVIHRDLKPQNLLVGLFSDVRVIDWGSAHVLAESRDDLQESFVPFNQLPVETDRGETIDSELASPLATGISGQPVTELFMPPEILIGHHEQLGPETDVYSMGVMLYHLLAGCLPYSDSAGELPKPAALRELIAAGPPLPVRTLDSGVSRDLAAICEKAMAHLKSDRYRTMTELGDDIRAVLEVRPVSARKPGILLTTQKWVQRHVAQVLLSGVILLVICAAFALTRGLQAQRDAARQTTALRDADLAARSGQWREALRHWGEAEAAGYRDTILLGLQRAEAWTVLSAPLRARAELDKLLRRSDLKDRRGIVLLRVGEHELFDKATSAEGVHHVQEALTFGLSRADGNFARGLLAESSPAALELFRQALRLNPYHHGAHRHSLGLEFLLGRHQEFESHSGIFKVLYPDDPSPIFPEAAELAIAGKIAEAQKRIEPLRDAARPELRKQMTATLQMFAMLAEGYDVDVLLGDRRIDPARREQLMASSQSDLFNSATSFRTPELPCLQPYRDGWKAVNALAIPLFADTTPSLQQIKLSWQHHPEALLPVAAGAVLEKRQPREGPKSVPLLATQAELFQMGADSPSMLPGLLRYARFSAATAQLNLARIKQTNAPAARLACLQNVRLAATSEETSAAECRAYFEMALELADFDLAHALVSKWERQRPGDQRALRSRIKLELAAGAIGSALNLIDQLLIAVPGDSWAAEQREIAEKKLKELVDSIRSTSKIHP